MNFYRDDKGPVINITKESLSFRELSHSELRLKNEQIAFLLIFGATDNQPKVPRALRAIFETLPPSIKQEYQTAWQSEA